MRNIITLVLTGTAILDLLIVAGTSFSQKAVKPTKQVAVDSSVILADPKFQKFIADTAALSKKFEQKVDSVRIEQSITKQRQEGDKALIKVQKKNFDNLYEIKSLTSHGLDVLNKLISDDTKSLPDIPKARPSQNIQPLEVCIDLTPPDTLHVPKPKKSFFKKLKFWE